MTVEQVAIDRVSLKKARNKGVRAAVFLAILSVIEYFIAIEVAQPLWPMLPIIAFKCWIILDVFMHVRAVFHTGDDH
jgi:hypothetical protein